MLILNMHIDESIIINGNVKIRILQAKGNMVRFGAEAPKDITIHREEVWHKIRDENKGNK